MQGESKDASLDKMAKQRAKTKKKAETTLRLEMCDELWYTLYNFKSEPIPYEPGRKIRIRVISPPDTTRTPCVKGAWTSARQAISRLNENYRVRGQQRNTLKFNILRKINGIIDNNKEWT